MFVVSCYTLINGYIFGVTVMVVLIDFIGTLFYCLLNLVQMCVRSAVLTHWYCLIFDHWNIEQPMVVTSTDTNKC